MSTCYAQEVSLLVLPITVSPTSFNLYCTNVETLTFTVGLAHKFKDNRFMERATLGVFLAD